MTEDRHLPLRDEDSGQDLWEKERPLDAHLVEERCRENIDAFGDFTAPGAEQLCAEQASTLPITGQTEEERLCPWIIDFVIPGRCLHGQRIEARLPGFVVPQPGARNHQIAHFDHLRAQ